MTSTFRLQESDKEGVKPGGSNGRRVDVGKSSTRKPYRILENSRGMVKGNAALLDTFLYFSSKIF